MYGCKNGDTKESEQYEQVLLLVYLSGMDTYILMHTAGITSPGSLYYPTYLAANNFSANIFTITLMIPH